MKRLVLSLLLAVLVIISAPSFASAIGISLSYTLNFYPPNPCVDSSLTGSLGIYDLTGDGTSLASTSGPQDASCNGSSSGAFIFSANPGALLYLSFEGAVLMPESGPPYAPVFAFLEEISEGDDAVAMIPSSAPLLFIGEVSYDGILIPSPGPPEFPLFSFLSPGVEVGSLSVAMAPVPEPGMLLLVGSGLAGPIVARKRILR